MIRVAVVVSILAGCNPYDRDLGSSPFLCGPTEPRCPKDYGCMTDPATGADVCFASGATTFTCADDGANEPNETFQAAKPMDGSHLAGLAICPIGDVDTFSIVAAANQSVELDVTFDAVGAPLTASILGATGAAIANATPADNMPDTIRAVASNVAAGTLFVQVAGPQKGINNYELTVTITGP